ncbi:unnamed protein product [Effrenium voratum]|nr:unnamed protein product [Effrenium voratum]CAJ1441463.1 unnamed protein product [Effrenium voratum]
MVTATERIKNLDTQSSVWVTKDQREAGLKYLVEKHARQGAAITARTLSGLMVNAEELAEREEAEKSQKRQREGELSELVAEMARAEEATPSAPSKPLFARQAAKDTKAGKKMPLVVVKKQRVEEGTDADAKGPVQAPERLAPEPEASEAPAGLLGAYGSDSEDEEDEDE